MTHDGIQSFIVALFAAAAIVLGAGAPPLAAQDGWFADERDFPDDRARRAPARDERPYLPPMDDLDGRPVERIPRERAEPREERPSGGAVLREELPPPGEGGGTVDRAPGEGGQTVDRAPPDPVTANGGSGLPADPWSGLDIAAVEKLFVTLDIPPRSPAAHALWRRLLAANAAPGGADGALRFTALRAEAMYRSGLIEDALKLLDAAGGADPLTLVLKARAGVGLGDKDGSCKTLQGVARDFAGLPSPVKREAILMLGYCAAAAGDAASAGLSAEMAREEGLAPSPGLDVLDALSEGRKPKPTSGEKISPVDYRILELAGGFDLGEALPAASPALLAIVAKNPAADPAQRLLAGEAAMRVNAISAEDLAALYRTLGGRGDGAPPGDKARRRAALFAGAEAERDPNLKARAILAFLDEARALGGDTLALRIAGPLLDGLSPAPDLGWFSETAVEIRLAGGDPARARDWLGRADGRGLSAWGALVDIAAPDSRPGNGESLALIEDLALRGAFSPLALHRLATVLDALDYNVPIPLWEAASRTPQPDGGFLPETGVLPDLQDAAKKREIGRVALLVLATLGPGGVDGAHIIALGDAIRALKRAGLEADARRLGLEAVFAFWPRSSRTAARDEPAPAP